MLFAIAIGLALLVVLVANWRLSDKQSHQVSLDDLTQVATRRTIMAYAIEAFHRQRDKAALNHFALLDIANFKKFNHLEGHEEGDKALCWLAQLLRDEIKFETGAWMVGRYAGDEFLLVFSDLAYTEIETTLTQIQLRFDETAFPQQNAAGLHLKRAITEQLDSDTSMQAILLRLENEISDCKRIEIGETDQ